MNLLFLISHLSTYHSLLQLYSLRSCSSFFMV
nr:MAG TPA: hypothetical protein [Caudoviricetes sp.]